MSSNQNIKIVEKLPPKEIYDRCVRKFGIDFNQGIIFTVDDKIYAKNRAMVTADLYEHELTHVRQQAKMGWKKWWNKYLEDPQFRLQQEVEAYRNQYKFAKENYSRDARRSMLALTSIFLSGEMYGNLITKEEAKELIQS